MGSFFSTEGSSCESRPRAMASFETQFFGDVIKTMMLGKEVLQRQCKYCHELVTDHQARRRNHLKKAVPGRLCATEFMAANGRSFKDFVFATQANSVVDKLYPSERDSYRPAFVSPLSTGRSVSAAPREPLGDGASGGGPGGGGTGTGGSFGVGGGAGGAASGGWPSSTPGPLSPATTGSVGLTPPSAPALASARSAVGSRFVVGNVLGQPSPREAAAFQHQLVRVMAGCGYSAHSMQHPEWKQLVRLLRPGMEDHIPSDNTLLYVRVPSVMSMCATVCVIFPTSCYAGTYLVCNGCSPQAHPPSCA